MTNKREESQGIDKEIEKEIGSLASILGMSLDDGISAEVANRAARRVFIPGREIEYHDWETGETYVEREPGNIVYREDVEKNKNEKLSALTLEALVREHGEDLSGITVTSHGLRIMRVKVLDSTTYEATILTKSGKEVPNKLLPWTEVQMS